MFELEDKKWPDKQGVLKEDLQGQIWAPYDTDDARDACGSACLWGAYKPGRSIKQRTFSVENSGTYAAVA